MRKVLCLALVLLTGCQSIQLASYRQSYPIENGKVWMKSRPQNKAAFERSRNAALVFMALTTFAIISLEMLSTSQRQASMRRLDHMRTK